jgi:small subunit ribosomal protein S16
MRRDGRFLENLGTYNPEAQPKEFLIKTERVAYWLSQGAEPSETVNNLLKQDRFYEKNEALAKGLAVETVAAERLPERKRKSKPKKQSSAS